METIRPNRNIRLLLGFLLKPEVDLILKQNLFQFTESNADVVGRWRFSRDAVTLLSPLPPVNDITILDNATLEIIDKIRTSGTYRRYYDGYADYQFALVPVNALMSPQCFADIDYITELARTISPDASLEEQIRFSLPEGSITEPIIVGSQVIFTSHRKDLHADAIPSVREVAPGEFEIVVRASSRPNYVQVAMVGNKLMLANGVHHVCAMALRGYTHVPCLLRQASRFEEALNVQQTSLLRPELLNGPRPAQVIDFLSESLAVPALLRSRSQVLRVGIGVEVFDVPALSPAGPSTQTITDDIVTNVIVPLQSDTSVPKEARS